MKSKTNPILWIALGVGLLSVLAVCGIAILPLVLWMRLAESPSQVVFEDYSADRAMEGIVVEESDFVTVDRADDDTERAHPERVVRIDGDNWPQFSPSDYGDELTALQFFAIIKDPQSTELQKTTFQETARGAPVNWLLQLENVAESGAGLAATFSLPLFITSNQSGRGQHYEVVKVTAAFSDEAREDLMQLRRGDWMRVRGTLQFERLTGPIAIANPQVTPEDATAEDAPAE